MKKHKSVVAILLAVMMIFTMMPAMAFAASEGNVPNEVVWADGCNSVTVTSAGVSTTYTSIKKEQQDNGLWKASIDSSAYSYTVPEADAYYWDLNGAKIAKGSAVLPTNYTHDNFMSYFTTKTTDDKIVSQPAAFAVKKGTGYAAPFTPSYAAWTGVFTGFEAFNADNNDAQQITIGFDVKWGEEGVTTGTQANPFFYGTPDPVTVNVAGKAKTAADIKLYVDEVKEGKAVTGTEFAAPYTGEEHKVVVENVDGYTVSFEVYDAGKWSAVDAVTFTNVGDVKSFRVIVKDSKGAVQNVLQGTKKTKVNSVVQFGFGFETTDDDYSKAEYSVSGEEYNALDYVKAAAGKASAAYDKAQAAADAKAVAANKSELMNFFNDYYEISATPKRNNANDIALAIAAKDLGKAKADLDKKYAQLIKNFGITSADALIGNGFDIVGTAHMALNDKGSDVEIEFVNSPTVKTYKAKVLKKKAKSFKVKAVATNEAAVSYKLINAPAKIVINKTTGKITLKKGLKKGTYKIKVKAYLPGTTTPFGAISETHAITIKVKK